MPKSPKPTRRRVAARSVVSGAPAARASAPSFSPAQQRARQDGWTPERQVRFVEALAECGCVEEACAAVGMSKQSAYGLRTRIDAQGFRVAWDAAIDLAIRRLSDACLSRALNGEVVPHYFQGELVGEHRRYDNRLAMFLLRYRDPLRYAATLDQMVYSGHPETAAFTFAKARDRAADEADGLADTPPPASDPAPWTTIPIAEAEAAGKEEALIDGNGKVHGSFERRERIYRLRREKHGARWAEENRAERAQEEGVIEALCAALEKTAADRARAAPAEAASRAEAPGEDLPGGDALGGDTLGGDRASTSSTSARKSAAGKPRTARKPRPDPAETRLTHAPATFSYPGEPLSKTDVAAWEAYAARADQPPPLPRAKSRPPPAIRELG